MNEEGCNVGIRDDDMYGWKLKLSGDCSMVLEDINKKLGEYGRRYFEDRLVFEPEEPAKTALAEESSEEA